MAGTFGRPKAADRTTWTNSFRPVVLCFSMMLASCAMRDDGAPEAQAVQPAQPVSQAPPAAAPAIASVDASAPVKPRAPQAPSRERLTAIDLAELAGLDATEMGKRLGQPDSIIERGPSQIWVYEVPRCELRIVFYRNLQTTKLHALQHTLDGADGKPVDDTSSCMREIQLSRRHD